MYDNVMATMQKQYVEDGGTKCPYCGSENLDAEPVHDMEDTSIYVKVCCLDCASSWCDRYKLVGFEPDVKGE